MKRFSTFLAALLCTATAIFADGPFRNHRYDSFKVLDVTSDNIVFIGNSITDMHCWPEAFVTNTGEYLPIVNRGNSGTYSTEQSDNLESYINGKPKKVFMMIGTNDIATSGGLNFSPEQVLAYVKSIVARIHARSPQTKVYLYSILKNKTGNRVEATWLKANELTKAYADATDKVTYIDLYDKLAGVADGGAWSYDNLHLTAGAYQAWCETICQYLQEGEDYTVSCVYPENTLTLQNAGGLGGSHGMRGTYFSCLPIKSNDVLVFGDSFIKNGEWQELLGNPNVKNRGTGWNNSGDIATTSKIVDATYANVEGVAKADAKAIFLYTGTADCTGSTDIATVKANYKALVDKIAEKSPTSKIYLMAICPRNNASHNTRIAELNAYMESIATGNIRFVDSYTPMLNGEAVNPKYVFSNDYIGGLAYAKIANLMKEALLADFPSDTYSVTTEATAETRYAQAGLRNQLTQQITRGLLVERGNGVGQYKEADCAALDTKLAASTEVLGSENITENDITTFTNELNAIINALFTKINMPTYSTEGNEIWYQLSTPGRGNKYVTSTSAGAGVVGNDKHNYATGMWKFVNRTDGKGLDIINRHDNSYLAATAANNTQLTTSATQPATGWTISYANAASRFIISNGTVQLNQTDKAGTPVYNWGGGTNRDDTGCQYRITLVENEPDEIPDPSVMTMTLTPTEFQKANGKSTWTYHGSVTSGGWYGKFVTGTTPALTVESTDEAANNIGWSSNQPWLKTGYTYNLTLPEGYVFVGYELTTKRVWGFEGTYTYTTASGTATSETQTDAEKTVTINGLKTQTITLKVGDGLDAEKGILITKLVIKYKEVVEDTGNYSIEIKESTGTGVSSSTYTKQWSFTKTDAIPVALTFSCGSNNMNVNGGYLQLHCGTAGTDTYTIQVPSPYVITGYSFDYAFGNSGTNNKTITVGEQQHAVAAETKNLAVTDLNTQSTQFKLSGSNEPVKLTNFIVNVINPEIVGDEEEEVLPKEIKSDEEFENGGVYTFVTKRGWMGATASSDNVISTAKTTVDPAASATNTMFQWAVYKSAKGNYYLYNIGKRKYMGVQSSGGGAIPFVDAPNNKLLTFKQSNSQDYPIMLSTDNAGVVNHSTDQGNGLINWDSGWNNLSDEGSNHKVTLVSRLPKATLQEIAAIIENYDNLLPSEIAYTVDKTNGALYKNGTTPNESWNNTWKSTTEPQLVFSCGPNNMNWAGNNVQLMTGGSNCRYTLTAPAGYVIYEYSFTYANNGHDNAQEIVMDNGAVYTTSTTAKTISAKKQKLTSLVFDLKGPNDKGVVLTDFVVKVKLDVVERPQVSTEGNEYWYYITSASTQDYCAGKVMYYDSDTQKMRFGDKTFSGNYIWSFWEQNGKLAIKNYNGEYFGTAGSGTGNSTAFGVVSEPNYIYNVNEAHGFFIIKDNETELHAQSDNKVIVRWGAAAGNASLWKFDEVDVSNAVASLASTVVQQGKVSTGIGNVDQPIIRSTLYVGGLDGKVTFQGVKGAFSGTNKADVTNVKAYFATNSRELFIDAAKKMTWREENGEQFGATVTLAEDGTFTITGTKELTPGNHYLWITYDIAETAKEGNLVDAAITSYTVDGKEIAEANGNPKHSVTIFLSEGAVLLPMDKGSLHYRIPAITVTKDGKRLVVLTDDRKQSQADLPNHCYVVAQYSDDLGKTWSDPVTVAGTAETGGNYGHGDASIVTNRDNGDIIGIVTSAGTYGHGFFAGTAAEPPRWKTITSHDGGETWDAPVDHTDDLFGANCDNPDTKTWKSGFSGSGAALQKRDGTLVSSFVNRAEDNSQNFHFFMSKDGGKHWYVSGTSGTASADEPKTLERNNGDLAISVRASGYNYYNVTSDNGATWHKPSQTRFTTGISGNACDGEYMVWCSTLEGNPWNIAFQTIPNSGSRQNVSIALSTDEGETFGTPKTICPRGSAYSATVVLPDGTLGCYYEENGLFGGYTMRFVRFSLDWASNGEYKFTEESPFKPIKSVEPAAVTSTISDSEHKIGTFYANDPVNIPEGVKAYAAIEEPTMENGEGVLKMTEIEDIIPAHTGVVIRAEKGDYSFTQASTNGTVVNGNMLVGYAGPAEYKEVSLAEGYTTYVLAVENKKAGFYKKEAGFKVYNHKAYLNVPKVGDSAPALTIRFEGDGSTEIEKSEIRNQKSEMIYDLMGRRVENPTKGVYIVGGRKVVIK